MCLAESEPVGVTGSGKIHLTAPVTARTDTAVVTAHF